ncbi:MAG: hypothetical protein GX595_16040, partial [Lentisphaerae bacterium]|nr:hypothetical protein [Lentisphaerota bacterium]
MHHRHRSFARCVGLSLVSAAAALAAADAALPSLTSGCYYTPARIAAGLENVRRFDW